MARKKRTYSDKEWKRIEAWREADTRNAELEIDKDVSKDIRRHWVKDQLDKTWRDIKPWARQRIVQKGGATARSAVLEA